MSLDHETQDALLEELAERIRTSVYDPMCPGDEKAHMYRAAEALVSLSRALSRARMVRELGIGVGLNDKIDRACQVGPLHIDDVI